jgi:ATP-binding cassette subfamily B protein
MRSIITLPLGVFDEDGTGKIRRIVNDSTAATETYIAHNLPDKTVAAVTPVGLLVLVFAFNWKIGLLCFISGFAYLKAVDNVLIQGFTGWKNWRGYDIIMVYSLRQ